MKKIAKKIRSKTKAKNKDFNIVGIGASAGGLSAFGELLKNIPGNTGMSFVIIQHLFPGTKSGLSEILSGKTAMPVSEVKIDTPVEANHIYVLPADKNITVEEGLLKLSPRKRDGLNLPIDIFFTSLAKYKKQDSIGIILSGTGSDGTLGMKAIQEAGGITFAQDETAEFPAMPENAVAEGTASYILSPAQIAEKLASIGKGLSVKTSFDDSGKNLPEEQEKGPIKIISLLFHYSSVDFTYYKQGTIRRRIMRRMLLNEFKDFNEYAAYLKKNPGELENLYQDILIKVTGFFRDPKMFDYLRSKILPSVFKNASTSVRIWVPGCSTGEETYSLAILVADYMEKNKIGLTAQIFGTDINESALGAARKARYSKNIELEVEPYLLKRFFNQTEDGGYEIAKEIRSMCVFARHNMIADTPFSKMDIVSCRNVLIYLDSLLQKKAFPIFHYALNPKGILILGTAETAANFQDLFASMDVNHKIYIKKTTPSRLNFNFQVPNPPMPKKIYQPEESATNIEKEADNIVLRKHAPAGVIVNDDLAIIQFRGDVSPYLKLSPGKAALDLIKMVNKNLLAKMLELITKARKSGVTAKGEHPGAGTGIEVIPLAAGSSAEKHFLILFENLSGKVVKNEPKEESAESKKTNKALEQELNSTIDQLQALIETRNAANEELRSAHEELMSANEELQSTNEELETTKEELQSTNEELMTLNRELQNRNAELRKIEEDHKKMEPEFKMRGEELYRKDEFISILGHELRNPLAPIMHSLELARLHGIKDPKIKPLIDIIERQTNLLNEIIKSLLDAARATSGKIEIKPEPADFNTIVNHAVETAKPLIGLGRHTLELHLLDKPVRLLLDPLRVEQIIVNLLNNAAKYTPPGGKITVNVNRENDNVVLSVKDNGIGISEEMIPQLFKLFSQGDQTQTRFKGGLGIGLMLARIIAQLHGGSLTVSSAGTGKGSEFTLNLPIKKIPDTTAQKTVKPKAKEFKLKKKRIFVVDDNVVLADVFGKFLRFMNQDVTVMYDGASVIEAVRVMIPDIIFVDISMPYMSGYELAGILRKDPKLKKVKLIALSGFGDEYREKTREAGFDTHLTKPIDTAALKKILA
ncbi:MAG: ATP-binding protein [Candidatus Pacebacteria bacterium]|nr:ATP-binding protein [Candidatus Paceibacterota bacterium]